MLTLSTQAFLLILSLSGLYLTLAFSLLFLLFARFGFRFGSRSRDLSSCSSFELCSFCRDSQALGFKSLTLGLHLFLSFLLFTFELFTSLLQLSFLRGFTLSLSPSFFFAQESFSLSSLGSLLRFALAF